MTRDTPSAIRMILAGECVALAADIVSEEAMQGLAVRPVVDPVRWAVDGHPDARAARAGRRRARGLGPADPLAAVMS